MDISLSTSAFRDAATCLKRYEYRWVDGLVPRPRDQAPALRKGLWLHRTLELVDHGVAWIPELDNMLRWALENGVDEGKAADLHNEVCNLTKAYVEHWAASGDFRGWTTEGTEVPFTLEPVPGRKLTATVDVLKRDPQGRLWIWERKCLSEIPDSDWRCVDPQTMLQLALMRTQYDEPVQGVVFDYVRTSTPPVVQVKNDGLVYKGCDERLTTTASLLRATPQIRANWRPHAGFDGPEPYIGWLFSKIVADGLWFQRYPTLRSDESLVENMRDVADTMKAIVLGHERNYFRRAWHPLTCPRFCPYMRLCANEYQLGRRNEMMRQELFTDATQDMWDQGRSKDAA